MDESGKRELLHRLEIGALRIRQGSSAVRPSIARIRRLRLRAQHGEKRSAGNAASDYAPQQRIAHVAVWNRASRPLPNRHSPQEKPKEFRQRIIYSSPEVPRYGKNSEW